MIFISETTRERMRSTENLVRVGDFEIRGRASKMAVWSLEPSGEPEASAPAATYASVARGAGGKDGDSQVGDAPAGTAPSAARVD
jgi:hypothetical protein